VIFQIFDGITFFISRLGIIHDDATKVCQQLAGLLQLDAGGVHNENAKK